jgi:flagellin-specific chaperone FliS
MMSLSSESQYNEAHQKSRHELMQLLLDEIIFLGSCYDRAKSLYQQRTIRNAGSKLQKLYNKQKKEKSKLMPYAEFQKIVKQVYQIIANIINNF